MALVKWLLLLLIAGLLLLPLGLLGAAIQSAPLVNISQGLNQENVARIKEVLRDADPRWLRVGDRRTLSLVEDDFNLILNYGLRHFVQGAVQVKLESDSASVSASIPLPGILQGRYFNTGFRVDQSGDNFTVRDWRLGDLPLPDWLSRQLVPLGHRLLSNWPQYLAALSALEQVQLTPNNIQVTYHWQQELKDQLRATGRQLLFSDRDQERLRFYHQTLYRLSGSKLRRGSLAPLLGSLFEQAGKRSTSGADAVAENRALLTALSFHLARVDLSPFLTMPAQPLSYQWLLWPTLSGRRDLAQHFVISAGISATAGTNIAEAAGLFKELKDSQGGSGFSFADLAADRAGTRFALLALDPSRARDLQQRLQGIRSESDFMVDIERLPEGMQRAEFTRRYDNLDNAAYRDMLAEIERRLDACALYSPVETGGIKDLHPD